MELRTACVEIAEKIEKAKNMARIYLADNYEYQEVAEPLGDVLELLSNLLGRNNEDSCAVIVVYSALSV